MTGDLKREAYERLLERELELERVEQELSAAEHALDARWAGHERRLRVLEELYGYVCEREVTLRERAARLRLSPEELDEVLPPSPSASLAPADMSHVAASMERASVIEDRERLCRRREDLLGRRRQLLVQAADTFSLREEALISRERELATAFRLLVERAGQLAQGTAPPSAGPAPARTASVPPPLAAPDEPPLEELEVVPILGDEDELEPPAPSPEPGQPPEHPAASQRRFPRIELNAAVDVGSVHNFFEGRTENLGVGGLFVATNNLLKEGREVVLRLTLPGEGLLKIQGRVAWRRLVAGDSGPAGLGIAFSTLDPSAAEAIERFVAQRVPGSAAG